MNYYTQGTARLQRILPHEFTLMTVDEYRELPEGGELEDELHFGEVFAYRRPTIHVSNLRHRLFYSASREVSLS